MASGSGVTLDKVTIEIQASSKTANTNIRNLSKTLTELKEATKGGFNNLNKLAVSLKELSKASKDVPTAVENLAQLKKVTNALSKLSSISTPRGLKQAIDNLQKLPATFAQIDANVIDNVARVSDRLATSLQPLANQLGQISVGLTSLSTLAKNYGVSITKVANENRKAANETTKLNKSLTATRRIFRALSSGTISLTNKMLRPLKKLHSKIKQIGLSLLGTRTIFTLTRKAVSEYMAMDQQLSDSIQNTWRALGAQLAPAIEYVMYLFKQFVRVIYSIVYALTGIDLIARANARALASMGKSAKDTLGSLQKFDDLNVAEFDKGTGDNMQIELDKIDLSPIQEVIDWMKRLKEEIQNAWKTGKWTGVAEVLADGINGAINSIDPEGLANVLTNVITEVLGFISTLIDKIEWYKLGEKIRETIENINWKEIWDDIVEIAKESFRGLGEFINGLFGKEEGSDFGGNLIKSLLVIWGFVQLIRGVSGFAGILSDIGLIGKAPGLISLITKVGGVALIVFAIYNTFKKWKDFFKDPTIENFWTAFYDTLKNIGLAVAGIGLLTGNLPLVVIGIIITLIGLIGDFLNENLDAINEWAYNLGKKLRKRIDDMVDTIKTKINVIKKLWDNFTDDLKQGAKNMGQGIVDWVFKMINKCIDAFNWLKKQINKFKINIPSWVPEIGGRSVGFNLEMSSYVSTPKLETGTNEVPYEGLYHLHPGEAVVPKKYNPALGNGTDTEVGQKLDTLIAIMNNLEFTNVVNIGNKTLYKEQQRYNKAQNDKYGTTVNL